MTSQELDAAIESAEEDVIALRMIQDIKHGEYEKALCRNQLDSSQAMVCPDSQAGRHSASRYR